MKRIVLVLLFLPAAAWAGDELKKAQNLLNLMKFDKAVSMAGVVIRSADSGPEELTEAYRIQGLGLSALGRQEAALQAFRELLAIRPAFDLSPDISPKLGVPFYQAKAMARTIRPLQLRHTTPVPKPGVGLAGMHLTVTLESDPLGMVSAVRIRFADNDSAEIRAITKPVKRPARYSLKLPGNLRASEIQYRIEALNQHGAVLSRLQNGEEPFRLRAGPAKVATRPEIKPVVRVEPVPEPAPDPPPEPLPVREGENDPAATVSKGMSLKTWGHTAFWSGAALVVLGGIATWQAREAASIYNESNGWDTEAGDRSKAWAGVMYTGYIVGGLALVAGVTLWLWPEDEERPGSASSLGVVPALDGVVVTFGQRF